MKQITDKKEGKSMGKQYQGRSRVGGLEFAQSKSETERKTMIDPEKVMSVISKLPEIAEDLKGVETRLNEVSEPLEVTWVGTAGEAYARVEFYVNQVIQEDETKITNLHSAEIGVCFARKLLDLERADAAAIN